MALTKNQILISVFLLIFIVNISESARILGIIPTPSYSHQVVFQPLWKELSLRGHQVTVLTTNPINDPSLTNLTEIDTSFSYNFLTDKIMEVVEINHNPLKVIYKTINAFNDVFEAQLHHPEVKQLMENPGTKFDLLIVENILQTAMAFSKKFNCPFIGVIPIDANNLVLRKLGNPTHPVLYPDFMIGEDGRMSLMKRILSVVYDFALNVYHTWWIVPEQEKRIKKYFGEDYSIANIAKHRSLLFINSDPIFHPIKPINPNIIPIGGRMMRLQSKPLPKDLKEILDKARNGFIYFSLGSNVNSTDVSEKTISVILETFRELPYMVLWKYEADQMPNKPDNVVISKWLPQLAVLKHPKLKLFITHGGAQSMEEGISARVPMLGMPFFVDQPMNVKKMVNRGFGLSMDYKTLEKDNFKTTILEMINNPSYRNQIMKLAALAEDEPMTGLERAVWWTEYVIRHNGTQHLRSPMLDIPWYQYYLLDVFAVLALVLYIFTYISVLVIRIVLNTMGRFLVKYKKLKSQ